MYGMEARKEPIAAFVNRRRAEWSRVLATANCLGWYGVAESVDRRGPKLHPTETPRQVQGASGQVLLREALQYARVGDARVKFGVTGSGLTVAVLDTGVNLKHADFRGAIKASRNFSTDDAGAADIATDHHGHGTNVAGIIAANGPRRVNPKNSESV